jgi:hypothetical protein
MVGSSYNKMVSHADWLLLILDRCSDEERAFTKMLLWRAWSVHNNITHQSGPFLLSDSVFFSAELPCQFLAGETGGDGVQEGEGTL